MKYDVTIGVPVYKSVDYIQRSIESALNQTYSSIEFLIIDDCGADGSMDVVERMKAEHPRGSDIHIIRHEKNKGYGGNQKTCYKAALDEGADVIVMLHPDYQYNPKVVGYMSGVIQNGICDIMLGNRIRTRTETLRGGMPFYKYISNRFLSLCCNVITGENLGEWHSGLRAYSAKVLNTLPWQQSERKRLEMYL